MKWYVTAFAILLSYQEVVASDDDFRCDRDADTQRSELEIKHHFEAKGWEIRRIKREHGCFEIYAIDDQGRRHKGYIDPETLDVLSDDD